jgi:hypothetical protein
MRSVVIALRVAVPTGMSANAVERAAEDLAEEVLEIPGVSRSRAAHATEPGSKGVDVAGVGLVLLSVLADTSTVYELAQSVAHWARRERRYSVRARIDGDILEIDSASEADLRRIIDAVLRRHEDD